MSQAKSRARPPRMPSLQGPISSPTVSAERVVMDSAGFESGPKSPDTGLENESQRLQLYPEAPHAEHSPESKGTFLHGQSFSSPPDVPELFARCKARLPSEGIS